MAFVNERIEAGKWQTIDRERNIVLEMVGEMLREPFPFNFDIEGETVRFEAFQNIKQLDSGYEIQWHIIKITASPHLKLDKSRLHAMIAEALDVYGFAASRKIIESVSVTFPSSS